MVMPRRVRWYLVLGLIAALAITLPVWGPYADVAVLLALTSVAAVKATIYRLRAGPRFIRPVPARMVVGAVPVGGFFVVALLQSASPMMVIAMVSGAILGLSAFVAFDTWLRCQPYPSDE